MPTSPKQDESFLDATHRFNIWVGSISSGKTYISMERFAYDLRHGPKGEAMILGVNRGSIQRNILRDLYNKLGFKCPSEHGNSDTLYGRKVYFVGCPDVSAVSTIQGSTLALAYVDEATCIPESVWKMLEGRMRVPGAKIFATCNPEGPSHWLKKDYIENKELDLIYWQFSLEDNPSLDEAYKQQIKASYTGMWYRRYIMGEWALATGAIYDTFDHHNEYTHDYPTPNYYIIGIDYGTTNATAAVLCGISPNSFPQVHVESEYYYDSVKVGRAKTDAELVRDIKEFIGYKSVSSIYLDPAAASLKIALRQENLPVIDAKNDVIPGIKTVGKFIAGKNISIHKSCKNLIEQIQSYAWCPKAQERGEDKPIKKNDHMCVVGDTTVDTIKGKYYITKLQTHKRDLLCVKSWNGKKFVFSSCSEVCRTRVKEKIIKLTLENGKTLKATPDHEVMTRRGFIQIRYLLKTDEVLCYD